MSAEPFPQSSFRFLFSSGEEAQHAAKMNGLRWVAGAHQTETISNQTQDKNRTFRCIQRSCESLRAQRWRTKMWPRGRQSEQYPTGPPSPPLLQTQPLHRPPWRALRDGWASIFNVLQSDSTNRIRGRRNTENIQKYGKRCSDDLFFHL